MSAERIARIAVLWGLTGLCGIVAAEDAQAPDIEFLEYLGSWEASEADWVLLAPEVAPENESKQTDDKSVDAPDGEKLAELNDEQ